MPFKYVTRRQNGRGARTPYAGTVGSWWTDVVGIQAGRYPVEILGWAFQPRGVRTYKQWSGDMRLEQTVYFITQRLKSVDVPPITIGGANAGLPFTAPSIFADLNAVSPIGHMRVFDGLCFFDGFHPSFGSSGGSPTNIEKLETITLNTRTGRRMFYTPKTRPRLQPYNYYVITNPAVSSGTSQNLEVDRQGYNYWELGQQLEQTAYWADNFGITVWFGEYS